MMRVLLAGTAVLLMASGAEAQSRQGSQRTGGQLRMECYREMGYTEQQVRSTRISNAVIQQVNNCVARKQGRAR